jgi:transposase
LPESVALQEVEIWFQDEHRIGQQGTLTRVWTIKGTRPRILRQQQYLSAYIFGAVCPAKDKAAGLILPYADTAALQLHLEEISANVEKDKHAVVVMDRAGWHIAKELRLPSNLSILYLPPYSPELNPQEQFGRQLKQEHLSNRTFESYEDILTSCCQAWNVLTQIPNRIRSLCSRSWALPNL